MIYCCVSGDWMRYKYSIGFFVDEDGNKPVEAYLFDDRHIKDLSIMINVIQRLALVGQDLLDTKMAKRITPNIFELRKQRHRIMYAQDEKRFVLLSAFFKRTQKTPEKEIHKAERYYDEYQVTKGFYKLDLPTLK